jgi:hypothetical protein
MTRALVRTILERSDARPWKLQDTGVLGLWLDPGRRYRLHVWDPGSGTNDELVHDHPLDLTSTVVAGEITNTRYEEDPGGDEYRRDRYVVGDEAHRRTDSVRLRGTSTTYRPGESYHQAAPELHASAQIPGTVTVVRFTAVEVPVVTVCRRPGTPWVSGAARAAEAREVARFTGLALSLLDG